jgi:hypothetical protein
VADLPGSHRCTLTLQGTFRLPITGGGRIGLHVGSVGWIRAIENRILLSSTNGDRKKDLPVSAEPRMNLVRDGVSPTAKGKK